VRVARLPASLAALLLAAGAHAASGEVVSAGRVEALLINGGGRPPVNYQSHLLHVRELVEVLRHAGVPDRRITILSGDGSDPAADLALREPQPEPDYWLVEGTRLGQAFTTPTTFESSAVPGFALRPATRVEVQRWFAAAGLRLRAGDTLLLYVTDHGTKNSRDTRDNRITLWGRDEGLSVSELREQLSRLDAGVQVVMLMSQCFSGSFAGLAWPERSGLPSGSVCGYFSTTAERPAYGCYPENKGLENIGHSFDFLEELGTSGSFRNAHLRVLQHDMTPDVPLRASDLFVEELLRKKAAEQGKAYPAFVDGLLAEAWKRRGAWEPEIRLIDAIGARYGIFSPRALAEIEEQSARVSDLSGQLDTHGKAWTGALNDAAAANLEHFLKKRPDWAQQVSPKGLEALGPGGGRAIAGRFLDDLARYTRADAATSARLGTLRGKAEDAKAAAYRMEVRLGVVLRMQTILATIAGRVYLAVHGTRAERAAYDSLMSCEAVQLPFAGPMPGGRPPDRAAFPSLDEDLRVARAVLPTWMGIRFRPPELEQRTAQDLPRGAASVQAVYPDSPAREAGLEPGDVILGPPGSHFQDPGEIREWTMLATADKPATLDVVRGDERLQVKLVPRPYPVTWPELPGPLRATSAAPAWPPMRLRAYRGTLPADLKGSPHLLYFWATWCGPCKAALPELVAFERERKVTVIAITDEPAETLDAFFRTFDRPFPALVATDVSRKAFLAYGVSGTPTFVLVDAQGIVSSYSVGYSPSTGLGVQGWRWADQPRTTAGRRP
jgi:thiol-disulfide isomerase/thioredoxin